MSRPFVFSLFSIHSNTFVSFHPSYSLSVFKETKRAIASDTQDKVIWRVEILEPRIFGASVHLLSTKLRGVRESDVLESDIVSDTVLQPF